MPFFLFTQSPKTKQFEMEAYDSLDWAKTMLTERIEDDPRITMAYIIEGSIVHKVE